MSKLTIAQKVSETNYYNNSTDADRTFDVSAKATVGAENPIINEGVVKLKGGDAIVAAFTKQQYDSLRISFAGSETPDTPTIKDATTAICDFLDAINELSE